MVKDAETLKNLSAETFAGSTGPRSRKGIRFRYSGSPDNITSHE